MPKVRFLPDGVEVDMPVGSTILQAGKQVGAHIGDACGGNCACSTCHVYVREGGDALSEQQDNEADILDKAFGVIACSRLGCQSRILRNVPLVVEISEESRKAWDNEHPGARE